jgi:adenylylsulfate kinase
VDSRENLITPFDSAVTREQRERLMRQKGCVVWFTGLSGSGKSTVACSLEAHLIGLGHAAYVLDGDNIRSGLNRDLGFSPKDRKENIRRAGELAALFADAGLIAITSFISPYADDRANARMLAQSGRFLEVYLSTPLAVCRQRDPKKLYHKADSGLIGNLTGVGDPYEPPINPELVLDTSGCSVLECVGMIMDLMKSRALIGAEK